MNEDSVLMPYTVYAWNQNGEDKTVGGTLYKRDARNIAIRFLNAEITRTGSTGVEKTVYTHSYMVKDEYADVFTFAELAKAKSN